MTIEDIKILAKNIPNNGVLIQTLEHHPGVDFESVVVTGNDLDFDCSSDDMLDLEWV